MRACWASWLIWGLIISATGSEGMARTMKNTRVTDTKIVRMPRPRRRMR